MPGRESGVPTINQRECANPCTWRLGLKARCSDLRFQGTVQTLSLWYQCEFRLETREFPTWEDGSSPEVRCRARNQEQKAQNPQANGRDGVRLLVVEKNT